MEKRIVGAHLSVAGGLTKGVDRAVGIGANALQFFAGSPRSWAPKSIIESELQEFQKYAFDHNIRDLFIHALYLINLVSENKKLVQKSYNVLIHNLKFAELCRVKGVVVHLGSHQGRGWEACNQELGVLIKKLLEEAGGSVPLLIENSAGQNGKLCSDLSEIRWLLDNVDHPNLGWCYDTCHGWAAGYSPSVSGGQDPITHITELGLWESLRCVHVNDSRDGMGSGRDRHANIGEGNIPTRDFELILQDSRVENIPLITEAPGFDGKGPDQENVERIKQLMKNRL
jgi:deoxyribonuclease-4